MAVVLIGVLTVPTEIMVTTTVTETMVTTAVMETMVTTTVTVTMVTTTVMETMDLIMDITDTITVMAVEVLLGSEGLTKMEIKTQYKIKCFLFLDICE